jgi:tetratricopeptide (TPR) repeat protein
MKSQRLILGLILMLSASGLSSCQPPGKNLTLTESLQLGTAKLTRGDYKGAVEEFDRGLSNDPNNPNLLVSRGLAHAQQGKLLIAIEDYTLALMENPTMHEALLYRGNAHNQLFQADQALADFSQALTIKPENPEVLTSRAITYYSLGQLNEAIADLQDAKLIFEKVKKPEKSAQIDQLIQDYQADRD